MLAEGMRYNECLDIRMKCFSVLSKPLQSRLSSIQLNVIFRNFLESCFLKF